MNNFERILGTVFILVVFFGLYFNKDNEQRIEQQIEESINK